VNDISWLWIPITLWAAFAQTLRNAAQRHLTRELGTIGATSVRFIYGLPFAIVWLLITKWFTGSEWPVLHGEFWLWVIVAAAAQIIGTTLLVRVMAERNFALGVAYSKTEAIQVAIIAVLLLGDHLSLFATAAIVSATLGVILISTPSALISSVISGVGQPLRAHSLLTLLRGWNNRSVWLGLGAGAGFALSAVGFRGATVALAPTHYLVSAAATLAVAQILQSLLLSTWMMWREPAALQRIASAWRGSLLAGCMGAAASAGWFTAMAIEPIAHVRTLGLIELLFSLVVSRRVFQERLRPVELLGVAMLAAGLILITLWR
jgi:drug/metabolite transporter (DMT)-like permease